MSASCDDSSAAKMLIELIDDVRRTNPGFIADELDAMSRWVKYASFALQKPPKTCDEPGLFETSVITALEKVREKRRKRLDADGGRGGDTADSIDRLNLAIDALNGELQCPSCEAVLATPRDAPPTDGKLVAVSKKLLAACRALPLDCAFEDAADFKDNARKFMDAMDLARDAIAEYEG